MSMSLCFAILVQCHRALITWFFVIVPDAFFGDMVGINNQQQPDTRR
jgi:hypothetical protein